MTLPSVAAGETFDPWTYMHPTAPHFARHWESFLEGIEKGLEARRLGNVKPLGQVIQELGLSQ